MSITATIVLFSEAQHRPGPEIMAELLAWSGVHLMPSGKKPVYVARSVGASREWNPAPDSCDDLPVRNEDNEFLHEADFSRIPDLFQAGTCLTVDLGGCPQGDRIEAGIVQQIPRHVRDEFAPGDVILRVGEHDLIEFDNGSPRLLGRAFSSVTFFGYSSPHDLTMMRRLTAQMPEMQLVCQELSRIIGPVQMCISAFS
ncbi:MAG: hypothetical protein JSS02_13120 [Planctomycetes bacterium]|nr:hypothetical protein [Planctomycetota bacterium]